MIRNLGDRGDTCLDSAAKRDDFHKPIGLWPCHSQGGNQQRRRNQEETKPAWTTLEVTSYCIHVMELRKPDVVLRFTPSCNSANQQQEVHGVVSRQAEDHNGPVQRQQQAEVARSKL
ncbi:hypothetical protein CEXT_410171 [Caerostris extrusa]|uniref:Uncharacterized protein n=1 Tax=Caerostris extrusa TaxID=172846 RepID=A0AAV4NM36_CAEEX|nr:hypothetical protein CEXT_410171 [Caerostris extrusa]